MNNIRFKGKVKDLNIWLKIIEKALLSTGVIQC